MKNWIKAFIYGILLLGVINIIVKGIVWAASLNPYVFIIVLLGIAVSGVICCIKVGLDLNEEDKK